MPNFRTELKNIPDEELEVGTNKHDVHYAAIELNELTRRAVKKVEEAVKIFNQQSSEQTKKVIILTGAIIVLTVIMIFGLIVQIILAIYK